MSAYRDRMRAQGRCTSCGGEPKPGCVDCAACINKRADDIDAAQAANRAAGRCACGREPTPGRKQCEECRARKRAWWTANRSAAARRAA